MNARHRKALCYFIKDVPVNNTNSDPCIAGVLKQGTLLSCGYIGYEIDIGSRLFIEKFPTGLLVFRTK